MIIAQHDGLPDIVAFPWRRRGPLLNMPVSAGGAANDAPHTENPHRMRWFGGHSARQRRMGGNCTPRTTTDARLSMIRGPAGAGTSTSCARRASSLRYGAPKIALRSVSGERAPSRHLHTCQEEMASGAKAPPATNCEPSVPRIILHPHFRGWLFGWEEHTARVRPETDRHEARGSSYKTSRHCIARLISRRVLTQTKLDAAISSTSAEKRFLVPVRGITPSSVGI